MKEKRSRVAEDALTAVKEPANLFSVLPLILANQDGKLLECSMKHSLRLTCKFAKTVVDPTLRTVVIQSYESILSRNDFFNAFRRSPITLAATKLRTGYRMTKEYMDIIADIQFNHVHDALFRIDSSALDLLPCHWKCGTELKVLDLKVYWHYTLHPPSQLNSVWKSFSKANWPLLESLSLDVDAVDFNNPSSDASDDDGEQNPPNPNMGEIACLLSYFPSLKHLKIDNFLSLADMKAIAAVPHEKLERVQVGFLGVRSGLGGSESGFMATLAEAKWPNLQELKLLDLNTISKDEVFALLKASWFKNLKKVDLFCSDFSRGAAKELLTGLQFGAVETLYINHLGFDDLVAFKEPMEFPLLKTLGISFLDMDQDYNNSQNQFNVGLSSFLSNTKLPCLESLKIENSPIRPGRSLRYWSMPPSFANTIDSATYTGLPALKHLAMKNFLISQDCGEFLGSLYSRGNCEIDLQECEVDSCLDSLEFAEILDFFSLGHPAFAEKLKSLKLYEKAAWFSLVSMDTLKSIAASMYLSNFAVHVNGVLNPVTECLALAEAAGAAKETSVVGESLQSSFKEALEAVSGLNRVYAAFNN
jgi:hypothetical protein